MHFLFLQIPPDLCCEVKDRFTVTKDWHQPCAKYDAQATDLSFNSVSGSSGLQKHSMKNSKEIELITKTRLSSLINTRNTCFFTRVFSHSWHAKSLLGLINPSMMLQPVTCDVFNDTWRIETSWLPFYCLHGAAVVSLQDTMFHTSNILYQKCKNSKHCPLVEIDTELRNQFFLTP